jgi:hypothetical protein
MRYLSDPDGLAPGTFCGIQEPVGRGNCQSSRDFKEWSRAQPQPDPDTNRDSEAQEALRPSLLSKHVVPDIHRDPKRARCRSWFLFNNWLLQLYRG